MQVSGYGHGSEGDGGGWPGLRQVLFVRTTKELAAGPDPAPIIEDHYYLTSLDPKSHTPEKLLSLVRDHWLVENELHHVKDRTMREDDQQHRPGASIMAHLRSLCVGLYRKVAGKSVPAKQERLNASPQIALKLIKASGGSRSVL